MAKFSISSIGSFFGSLFVPRTPRGRVRQAVFLVLALAFFAGNLSHPGLWNYKADWVNGKLEAAKAPGWARVPHFWNVPYRLGLDLQGGTHLVYVADMKDIPDAERAEAMAGVRDVIERRVNAFGVSEPVVQVNKSGESWRLIVDLAGIKDISEAIRLIGETPILEFKEQNDGSPQRELTADERKDMETVNAKALADAKATLKDALKKGADFEALARERTQDGATKENGGDLGFVAADGPYKPAVDRIETLKLAAGKVIPEVITNPAGHHVVRFDEKRESGKEVLASHILVCWQGTQNCEQARTKEEAQKLIDDLKAKATVANFAALAKESSDDPSAKTNSGDLGWFTKDTMVKEFADAAFALKTGEISGVVESPFGFHLIYKRDERPTYEYHLHHIQFTTKTAADYLPPPDPWKNTQLSGKHLKRAMLQFQTTTNEPQVALEFNEEGRKLFAEITERNVGKPVAIFLDGHPISTPTVQEAIREGTAIISGNFSIKEAKELVRRLNAGALPVPITLESQQSVGASLGKESLDMSLKAGLMGFLIVALFMLFYYRLPGLIAIVALGLYTAMNLALYKLIPVTLSLSGIAGFILSVGMAVDANVLIFERMKEELLRGRTLQSAIDEGFKRAWNSIRDSNFTSLISCAILFYTSSSLIKGFALNLALGVLLSMFSAITVSRTLLRLVSGWGPLKNTWLYLPGLHGAPKGVAEKGK
ncbi:MAG TPA: protein translocase subunit SecD [Candidatus Eisenbacteria bacterium]|nr:protein translocase subunit SecD [Candidatus Eisenbacteria bacterium]